MHTLPPRLKIHTTNIFFVRERARDKNLNSKRNAKKKNRRGDARCETCVDGQPISPFFVYCGKHKKRMYAFKVCEDYRAIEEVFDLTSDTPFTDWVKKERKGKKVLAMVSGYVSDVHNGIVIGAV